MKKQMLALVFVLLATGCSTPFVCNIKNPIVAEKISIPVDEIKIESVSVHDKKTGQLYPDQHFAFADIQRQFNESVKTAIGNSFSPSGGANKAIVRIEDTSMYITANDLLTFPFTGLVLLSAGYKSEYVATIDATIEIINNEGEVVDKVGFKIIAKTREKTGVKSETERGFGTVGSKAVSEIHGKLSENIKYIIN